MERLRWLNREQNLTRPFTPNVYLEFYNVEHLRQNLGYMTSHESYFGCPAKSKLVEMSICNA